MPNPSYISSNFLSGSNTEGQLEVDIPSMSKGFRNVLDDWAKRNGGACFVAEDDQEKIQIGFNNCIGPRVLVIFTGEEPYGDEQTAEFVPYVKRSWDIMVERGKTLTNPRNTALTDTVGNALPFYTLVEQARDIVRSVAFPQPMAYFPNIYNGTRPASSEGWLMDSYVISISVICQIARIQYQPPAIVGNGPYANLIDPPDWIQNQAP